MLSRAECLLFLVWFIWQRPWMNHSNLFQWSLRAKMVEMTWPWLKYWHQFLTVSLPAFSAFQSFILSLFLLVSRFQLKKIVNSPTVCTNGLLKPSSQTRDTRPQTGTQIRVGMLICQPFGQCLRSNGLRLMNKWRLVLVVLFSLHFFLSLLPSH